MRNLQDTIEYHINFARALRKSNDMEKRSNLDSEFCREVTAKEWERYRDKHNITCMITSPYYNSEKYFNQIDEEYRL